MAKIYLSELSAVLAEKHGVDRRTAQRFITSVVSVVQNGLNTDRVVKIKGLGTFKIIDVEARESVNVNTGERLVIDSHSKLTFLPDTTMKELVNRPFSQFETVVLNDGVEFSNVDEEEAESSVTEENDVPVEEENDILITEENNVPVVEETPVIIEEEKEEKEEKVEEPVSVVEQEEKPIETIQKAVEMPEVTEEDNHSETEQISEKKGLGWGHLAITALIALLVGGGIGYFIGHHNDSVGTKEPQPPVAQTIEEQQPQTTVEQPAEKEEETEPEPQNVEDDTTPIWEKYNDMDPRTRSGYYYITGLERTETAKAGDTSARIARRFFGAAELACYIEVFNGIDGRTVLEEGTEVKIPKIEPKKNVRKRLEQQNNQQ